MGGGAGAAGEGGARGGWVTMRGEIGGPDLLSACAARGVHVGDARLALWQRHGLFPLPAPSGGYHPGAPTLAAFIHASGARRAAAGGAAGTDPRVAIQLLRLRAGDGGRSPAAEDRFYAAVDEALRALEPPPPAGAPALARRTRRAPHPPARPPRWVTGRGTLSARELEAACAGAGVLLDRARRTYWQAERVFPQPERRRLRPPEANGGARGYYHAGAVDLARLIDHVAGSPGPATRRLAPWRCSVRDLSWSIGRWRAEAGADPADAEDAFYARIRALMPLVEGGRPVPGLEPVHRDVLPSRQSRIADGQRTSALEAAARVSGAIADEWLTAHAAEPSPDRLVVWFRLERSGTADWRIADAGAHRTSHDPGRARTAT